MTFRYLGVAAMLLILYCIIETVTSHRTNLTFPAIIVFGDSIVDPGNNNYLKTIARCDFPPYGRDLAGGKPTGRFSNGKIAPDFAAEIFGIKDLIPPYLDPNLKIEDLVTGVSFASGGAGYDPITANFGPAFSLSDQLDMFRQYLSKIKSAAGEEKAAHILSQGLFMVVVGSNDISNTYYGTPIRNSKYDTNSYTDFITGYASSFLQELYEIGARKMAVFGAPPIGCVPSQRTIYGGIERECSDKENKLALLFNSKLHSVIDRLNRQFSDSKIVYVDVYYSLLSIIQNAAQYGFEVTTKGCCGTGSIEVTVLCNSLKIGYSCPDASKYIFWDSFHPTERTYEILTREILQKYQNNFI
ncbi:GDSL esterase/lipase EXL3-like [Rutidosis leptorrhynchoides]|uniref:GDSL esterase/lipase EXL3-like n=1 Tax=Rutidosis leptorrhynchoides TaxID=125765 RepID=UPI003A9996A1